MSSYQVHNGCCQFLADRGCKKYCFQHIIGLMRVLRINIMIGFRAISVINFVLTEYAT
ncbi:Protein of unknown function [Pyronema omphalodes CBS 100304]|uniref:Uncharacterized protein n=1 Tax=Pyronema omphalodes (strain CBS 100304) TaxID=1076935 RepID=U4LLZ6_PYROM|nr:Protein of unknown function [Pyronema omphalodes CBS 100304]